MKNKLIPKGLLGWLSKLRDGFVNSTLTAAMADAPAVMIATGWSKDPKTGRVTLDPNWMDEKKRPDLAKLRNNLDVIATTAQLASDPGAVVAAGKGLYLVARHPVLTAKAVKSAVLLTPKLLKRIKYKPALSSKTPVDWDEPDYIMDYLKENPSAIVSEKITAELPEETLNMINDAYFRYTNLIPKEIPNFSWDKILDGSTYDVRNSVMMDNLENSKHIVYDVPFTYRRGAPEGFAQNGNNYYHTKFFSPSLVGHETNHTFRGLIGLYMFAESPSKYGTVYGYFPKETLMLANAYEFPEEILQYLRRDATSIAQEQGALNYEIRELLSLENGNITGKDLDKVIDKLSIEDIKQKLKLINNIYSTSDIKIDLPSAKEALKKVGIYAAPITVGTIQLTKNEK